MRSEAFI